jgi:hypothetical protein
LRQDLKTGLPISEDSDDRPPTHPPLVPARPAARRRSARRRRHLRHPGSGRPARAAFAAESATHAVKTASTYYTAEKVAAARRNIEQYDWARALRDQAVSAAEQYLAKGDEWLWSAVPSQQVPRGYAVNQFLGSPITGRDIFQFGNYSWNADPLNQPWKIIDPSVPADSGQPRVYPTNYFGAYYVSGLDEHGPFDPARADRSLLVNQLYPEKGPTWGVDDGYGWVDENGAKWTFIAYYHHWHVWYSGRRERGGRRGAGAACAV